MNIELMRKILSTKKVRHVSPDHFQFDFGLKIWAMRFEDYEGFKDELSRLCERPDFTIQHLRELLEYLTD